MLLPKLILTRPLPKLVLTRLLPKLVMTKPLPKLILLSIVVDFTSAIVSVLQLVISLTD